MKLRRILGGVVILILSTATIVWGWGEDIPIWTGGHVTAFDVDYDKDDGTMYVAFQVSGENTNS